MIFKYILSISSTSIKSAAKRTILVLCKQYYLSSRKPSKYEKANKEQ